MKLEIFQEHNPREKLYSLLVRFLEVALLKFKILILYATELFTTLEQTLFFEAAGAVAKELKIEPPLSNLACLNW